MLDLGTTNLLKLNRKEYKIDFRKPIIIIILIIIIIFKNPGSGRQKWEFPERMNIDVFHIWASCQRNSTGSRALQRSKSGSPSGGSATGSALPRLALLRLVLPICVSVYANHRKDDDGHGGPR